MKRRVQVRVVLIVKDGFTRRPLWTYASRPLPRGAAGRRFDRLLARTIVKCIMQTAPKRKGKPS